MRRLPSHILGMRQGQAAVVLVLLGGPTALAFFSGGYFETPRLWAGVLAWTCVAVAAIVCRRPWPRHAPAWLALAGLAGLAAWTGASIAWAPLRDVASGDAERLGLYLGVVVAGAGGPEEPPGTAGHRAGARRRHPRRGRRGAVRARPAGRLHAVPEPDRAGAARAGAG